MRYLLSLAALALILAACGSSSRTGSTPVPATPAPPTQGATPAPATSPVTASPSPGPGAYLALGDSLSAGVGASDRRATAFVPLVHRGLGTAELINLGIPGDTSADLLAGPLDQGIDEIGRRRADGDPANDVTVITLEIGGNDLLDLYFDLVVPGVCPSLQEGLANPDCVGGLQRTLDEFGSNLREALQRLREAAPEVPLFLLTLYNPFSGGSRNIDEVGKLALEGEPGTDFPDGLNDIIREEGAAAAVQVVDIYPLFLGKSSQYIYRDLIHPNDAGYRVMAGAVVEAMRAVGIP